MTNADKYLKDGVDENTIDDLAVEMVRFFDEEFRKIDSKRFTSVVPTFITKFFAQPLKPVLTEDEEVILRNIREEYSMIGKDEYEEIIFKKVGDNIKITNWAGIFKKSLFQFIKLRRRI